MPPQTLEPVTPMATADTQHEFDQDTAVRPAEAGVYDGTLTARWNIGTVPNGGYVLAVAMAALRSSLPNPDPLSVTMHYLRPSAPGPVRIAVETLKAGRSYSTAMARVIQAETETARVLATYGDLGRGNGPVHVAAAPPALPPRESLPPRGGDSLAEVGARFEIRSTNLAFAPGPGAGPAEVSGWIRFADGRRPDVHTLGLIADAFPPAAFHVLPKGWVPTLELTVHIRARPASEWLQCLFRTRFIFGGLLEEDGEVWDEAGTLVALSRQLAAAPR